MASEKTFRFGEGDLENLLKSIFDSFQQKINPTDIVKVQLWNNQVSITIVKSMVLS